MAQEPSRPQRGRAARGDDATRTAPARRGRPPNAPKGPAASQEPAADAVAADSPEVGQTLRRLRLARELSLEALARSSGVSRAMLSQIELGHSTPTIKVLWKIAKALDVPFSALLSVEERPGITVMRAAKARRLTSHDGRFSSRALFPAGRPRRVEFYELRLAPKSTEEAEPHAPGTGENLVVHQGTVEIDLRGETQRLESGDAISFAADSPHAYRNVGDREAVMYLVMTYGVE